MGDASGEERQLHVFTNGVDHVVAATAADAELIYAEHIGCAPDDDEIGDWSQCPDDATLTIMCEDGQISDCGERVQRTMREWINLEGMGFLCSSEY